MGYRLSTNGRTPGFVAVFDAGHAPRRGTAPGIPPKDLDNGCNWLPPPRRPRGSPDRSCTRARTPPRRRRSRDGEHQLARLVVGERARLARRRARVRPAARPAAVTLTVGILRLLGSAAAARSDPRSGARFAANDQPAPHHPTFRRPSTTRPRRSTVSSAPLGNKLRGLNLCDRLVQPCRTARRTNG